jgi:hypothetical protein
LTLSAGCHIHLTDRVGYLTNHFGQSDVQSFSFKLTALRSTFLYISIEFSLASVAFYMEKTVHVMKFLLFIKFTMINIYYDINEKKKLIAAPPTPPPSKFKTFFFF